MSSQRTQDILQQARDFHQHLSLHYAALHTESDQPRLRLLLEYLTKHEAGLADMLVRYERDAPRPVMETWFPYMPEAGALMPAAADLPQGTSFDELLAAAQECSRKVIALYGQAEGMAVAPEVQEVFRSLRQLEEKEQTRASRSALALLDI